MKPVVRILGAACAVAAVVAATLAWQAPAQSQIRVSPPLQSVGVGSGTATTAWFHDPASGRVIACQTTGSGTALAVACAGAVLP